MHHCKSIGWPRLPNKAVEPRSCYKASGGGLSSLRPNLIVYLQAVVNPGLQTSSSKSQVAGM